MINPRWQAQLPEARPGLECAALECSVNRAANRAAGLQGGRRLPEGGRASRRDWSRGGATPAHGTSRWVRTPTRGLRLDHGAIPPSGCRPRELASGSSRWNRNAIRSQGLRCGCSVVDWPAIRGWDRAGATGGELRWTRTSLERGRGGLVGHDTMFGYPAEHSRVGWAQGPTNVS